MLLCRIYTVAQNWKRFLSLDKAIQIQATVMSKLVRTRKKNILMEMLMTRSKLKYLCCKDSDKQRAVKSHPEYRNFVALLYLFLAFIIIHWILLEECWCELCIAEWNRGTVFITLNLQTREKLVILQLSKETGLIKEITVTKPYATPTRKRQFKFNECL